ncbi:hypothetical protein [Dysgonomonas sp. 25]|uniref:hypothetical protein n=1 Tax=Dysgonomonas sp. 25 TaxID=2302933 RepID=UPI0013D286D8|nr:hypothetical protein [Dysgonomonas sp. 25]NDV68453.1 hypothetical protein [Dysgonomonas sp. 25]
MDVQELYSLIEGEEQLDKSHQSALKALVGEYPYFQAAVFLYLKSLYIDNIDLFRTELERLSMAVSDRKALFFFIMGEEYKKYTSQTKKKELPEDKTEALLNAFFEAKGQDEESDTIPEYELGYSSLISSDYLTYMAKVEQTGAEESGSTDTSGNKSLKHQVIIDSFIKKSEEEGGIRITADSQEYIAPDTASEKEEELDDDLFFTETLSKIYIKQRKYEKAYKIIKHLSLNYPKKNVYFADQLSFLEKLIINSKFKDKI